MSDLEKITKKLDLCIDDIAKQFKDDIELYAKAKQIDANEYKKRGNEK